MSKKNNYLAKSFFVIMPNGTKKQIKVRDTDPKRLEQKFIRKKLEYEMGLLTFNSNTTLARWTDEWLTTYKQPKVTAKTLYDIKTNIHRVFLENIGGMKISEIKTAHLQSCLNNLANKSTSYTKKSLIYIKDIMGKAIINDLITKNPALGLEYPKGTTGQRRALTDDEISLFKQAILNHPKGLLFGISLACGLRPGEARALERKHINIKTKTINIAQAVESGTNTIKEPKTKAGIREIPIPNWYLEIYQNKPPNISPYAFPNDTGGIITEKCYRRGWQSLMREMDILAGAEIYRNEIIAHKIDQCLTPYYLRHTYATNLAEAGVDIKTAQFLLGHTNISVTAQIYTHVTNRMLDTARDKINAYQEMTK